MKKVKCSTCGRITTIPKDKHENCACGLPNFITLMDEIEENPIIYCPYIPTIIGE